MNKKDLKKILKSHLNWLAGKNGCRADLSGADLDGADLRGANLHKAVLSGADLREADLSEAYLREADLRGADLRETNLYKADLSEAYLRGANLRGADLDGADLSEAVLYNAYLYKAKNIPFIPSIVPEEGSFIGWKKANEYIVKLLIPDSAKRVSGTSRKCRCDKAKVLAIETLDGKTAKVKEVASGYDARFSYAVGKTVKVDNFENNRWITCAPGIHFFINRQEAVKY